MPFRAKVKKALGGSSSSGDPDKPDKSFLNKTAARRPLTKPDGTPWPDNVYKPGEPMPRPKYRGPWNQAHQDKLSAFSFGSFSSRRKSNATARTGSEYSPMGSKLPSRGPSRRNSSISWGSLKSGKGKWRPGPSQKNSYNNGGPVEENGEGDDDITNVGLSRSQTKEAPPIPTADETDEALENMAGLDKQKTMTNRNGYLNGYTEELQNQRTITNGQLFTEEELAHALSASTLKASRRERGYKDIERGNLKVDMDREVSDAHRGRPFPPYRSIQ